MLTKMEEKLYDYNPEEILKVFNNLKNTKHLPIQKTNFPNTLNDCIAIFQLTKKQKEKYMCLSDYFHGKHRLNAKRFDQNESPLEYFENNQELVVSLAEKQFNGDIKQALITLTKQCSPFSPFIAVQTFRLFNSRKILDLCAGWGDRLIAALSRDEWIDYYCGIDPNKQLSSGYQNMIKMFAPKHSRSKYELISSPAEITHIPLPPYKQLYDLIFTSPPFFDKEEYVTDKNKDNYKNQSIVTFKTFEDWYKHFLLYILANASDLLKIGGYIVLHIDPSYVERLKTDLLCVTYVGMIYIGDPTYESNSYEPMIVFQKNI